MTRHANPRGDDGPGERPGDVIDRYKLLQEIGEGGMGSVWMAEQSEPVKRVVALKIIKLGMDTKEVVARFEAERQALALMDHPHIAKVLDGGTTAAGRPFFVMELVKGVPITEYCDKARLGVEDRLDLFAKVCDAIQHAHHKGIIHRDIKPSNVMVALHEGVPVPKVIDFGIAKATNAELTQKTLFTRYAQMIGTPDYMAPEQAELSGLDVDTRADVYSLGVLLYELLTGSKPFDVERALQKGYSELLRTIREDEPAKPSTRIAALGRRLSGELDWIVMHALEKDRARRYETANGFAADVRRFLRGEPVHAAPPSAVYRVRKFARRHSGALLAAAAAIAVLAVAGSFYAQSVSAAAQQVAERSQRTSEAIEAASLALGLAISAPIASESEWVAAEAGMQRVTDLLVEGEVDLDVAARADALARSLVAAREERDLAIRLENVLIRSASHPDLESWKRMERQLAALLREFDIDLDNDAPMVVAKKIREHRFALSFIDVLELWIATIAQMGKLGGPKARFERLQPWADAIHAADTDPLRTGIRKIIYTPTPPTRAQVETLTSGVDLTAVSPRTIAWLTGVYARAGMMAEADELVRDALRRHPRNVMLNFDYGYGLAGQGRWQEAIRMYSRALALRPDAAGIWRMMGMALEQVDEMENACDAFAEACEHESDYGPSWISYGEVLLKLNRSADAVTAGRRAIGLMPRSPVGHGIVGRALMQQGDYTEALPVLEECVRLDEVDQVTHGPTRDWLRECREKLSGK